VLCSVEVLGGVFVFGGVAASDMATGHTETEVDPVVTDFETVFATRGARLDVFNLLDVGASGHGWKLYFSLPLPKTACRGANLWTATFRLWRLRLACVAFRIYNLLR
jgi:hypothetical protein